MKADCEFIRKRALEHGEGSPEYEVWLRHSRHCPECRSELYVRELLKEEGRKDICGCHLPAVRVADLVQLAEHRYRGGKRGMLRRAVRMMSCSWRVACVAALAYSVFALSPAWSSLDKDGVDRASSQVAQAGSGFDSRSVDSVSTAVYVYSPMAGGTGGTMMSSSDVELGRGFARDGNIEPEMLSGWDIEDAIQQCRKRIDRERACLLDSIQQEVCGQK